jgi:adenylate kinase family enzyme
VRRVSVVGNSGSGKSTVAAALSVRLGVPHHELDAVFHQPGWTELPTPEFRHRVAEIAATERWIIDGNYSRVRDIIWARADTVVWLDLPRPVVMRQVVRRTIRRAVRRTELWNGNREPWRNFATLDPNRSVIAWAWTQHAKYREHYAAAMVDPAWSQLRFVHLASEGAVTGFLQEVSGA